MRADFALLAEENRAETDEGVPRILRWAAIAAAVGAARSSWREAWLYCLG